MTTIEILKQAKAAKRVLAKLTSEKKNEALYAMADALVDSADDILSENAKDIEAAKGVISDVMIDRLTLTKERIEGMAEGIREVAKPLITILLHIVINTVTRAIKP